MKYDAGKLKSWCIRNHGFKNIWRHEKMSVTCYYMGKKWNIFWLKFGEVYLCIEKAEQRKHAGWQLHYLWVADLGGFYFIFIFPIFYNFLLKKNPYRFWCDGRRGYACAGVECKGNLCTFVTFAVNTKLCQKKKSTKTQTSIKKSKIVKRCNLREE